MFAKTSDAILTKLEMELTELLYIKKYKIQVAARIAEMFMFYL